MCCVIIMSFLAFFFNSKRCVTERLERRTISFLYQEVCMAPGKTTAIYWDPRARGPAKLPPWFLNAGALENFLLGLADPDALPYWLWPGDKALNAFKWLVLEPGNPLHCQCFHFNQRYPVLLHSPGHTAFSCLQHRIIHGLSLKASLPHFPALKKEK